jgi:hypothetical protein
VHLVTQCPLRRPSGPYPAAHALNTGPHSRHTCPQICSSTITRPNNMPGRDPTPNERFQYPAGTRHPPTNLLRLNQAIQSVNPKPTCEWEDEEGRENNVVFHRSRCILNGTKCKWSEWVQGKKSLSREQAAADAIQVMFQSFGATPYQ